jgi:hypothetical protein
MWTKLVTAFSALALCAAATGCSVRTTDGSPPPTSSGYGTLTALWTLDGAADSDVCAFYAIDRVDVVVFDDAGFVIADALPICEDFGISFDVRTGWYSTEMTLLDFDGFAVSDTVVVEDLRVQRNTETVVDVDFPDATIF